MNNEVISKRVNSLLFSVYEVDTKFGKTYGAEIVKFEPNWYYHNKENFVIDPENESYFIPKGKEYPFGRIHKSNFEHKEVCYRIASFDHKVDGSGWELKYCGDRPVRMLNDDEMQDFLSLISYGYNFIDGNDGVEKKQEEKTEKIFE